MEDRISTGGKGVLSENVRDNFRVIPNVSSEFSSKQALADNSGSGQGDSMSQ